jgi:hypothetical protein
MAKLTDQELLFLSSITYMEPEVIYDENGGKMINPFVNIWDNPNYKHLTIGRILKAIDTDALRNNTYLREHKFNGEIAGSEWADMIDAMKQSDLCELALQNVYVDDKNSRNAFFTDREENGYVVFCGKGADEWTYNFEGAYIADTKQQRRALDYINGLDAENITVTGHSKGGNQAKYAALLSDKVARCVSFDGQGFSRVFMEKYRDLIEANKHKVTCYASEEDFVNILLHDIYDAKYYIKGHGISSVRQNHSPSSFFNFYKDEEGKEAVCNFEITDQSEYGAELHSFINYAASAVPEEERGRLFSYLGKIFAMKMGKLPPDYTKNYTEHQMVSYLAAEKNTGELGLLLTYIVKYGEYDRGITDAVLGFMSAFGFRELAKWIRSLGEHTNTENILKYILEHHDRSALTLGGETPDYISDFIGKAAKAYKENKYIVGPVTAENIAEYDASANDTIRDYSESLRDMLLNLTDEATNEKPYDVMKWDIWYGMEEWFGHLNIGNYQKNIDDSYRKVQGINGSSHQQIQQIFDSIDSAVKSYTSEMNEEIERLRALSSKICNLINTDINSAC